MQKDSSLRIRIPAAGKAELQKRSAAAGLSMSEYVRLSVTRDLLADLTRAAGDAQPAR